MAISDKLEYLNDTKQLLKDKINNLGGSITDETTFRQYVNQLDGVYDVLPKTSFQEGTSVTIEGGLKGKIDFDSDSGKKIVGYGDTEQDGEPTPSTPVAIQCVTGEQSIVESGKNLFDSEIEQGGYYANGNPSESNNLVRTKDLMQIYDVNSNYVFSNENNLVIDRVLFYDSSQNIISRSDSIESALIQSSIIPSNTKYIKLTIRKSNFGTLTPSELINPMLEQGSTATPYEPYHTPITYPISLGNIEFYKIGDYADELLYDVDEDKVYKKAYIGEATIDGSGLWWETTQGVHKRYYTQLTNGSSSTSVSCFANYFKGVQRSNLANDNECSAQQYANFVTDNFADLEAFQTWLSTHNVVLQYVLATPTLTEITDTTLKQQVKNWYYSQSFTGTTILESNGDLPMIIKVRALKGE